ncbi:MAG: signal peptidase II [Calditrichaeota bacterium]|nr:MAG: signal peptidase II [Calditrichota bacterium]
MFLSIFIIVVCLVFDQATKTIAHENLPRFHKISFINDTIRLQYAENAGAAFSIGANLPEAWRWAIFGLGQGIFLLLLAYYLIKNRHQMAVQFYGFVFILGGGLGNFLDRLYRDGVVVDFLNVGFGTIRTAIFNVADMAITLGLALLIWSMIQQSREEKKEDLDAIDDELPAKLQSEDPNPL